MRMSGAGIVPPVAAWAVLMGRKVRDVSKEVQTALARQHTVWLYCSNMNPN
jgi:hypothetical protein